MLISFCLINFPDIETAVLVKYKRLLLFAGFLPEFKLINDFLREMLSSQQHYDWGLRALKTVLRSCGNLLVNRVDKNEVQVVVDVFFSLF